MGIVNVFRGLGSERETRRFNGRIRKNLDLDWKHCKMLLGDREITKNYSVKEGDVVYIREYPGAVTAALAAGAAVVAAVSIGVGIWAGIRARNAAKEAARQLEDALRRMRSDNRRRDVESIPHLSGARNEFAEGKQAPIILGRHLFAPYFLSEPYLRPSGTDGNDLYWHGTFLVGQTGLKLEKIRNGMIDLASFPGDSATESGTYRFDAPPGGDPESPPPFHDPENRIEVRQEGLFSEPVFNERWEDSLEANAELGRMRRENAGTVDAIFTDDDGPEPVVRESARFPMRIEAEILIDGLHGWDSENGVPTSATVDLRVEWGRSADGPWIPLPGWNPMRITRASTRQLRFIAAVDLPASVHSADGAPAYVRATRLTRQHVGSHRSRAVLTALRTRQYSPRESSAAGLVPARNIAPALADRFCRIGVKLKVNRNTQDALDRFNVIASMTGRTWNGGGWSLGKKATSNPAAVALEALTGLIHEPSRHGDAEIDLGSLGRLYEWCESREVNVGGTVRPLALEACGALVGATRKLDVLRAALATADAGMHVGEFGKLKFWYDDFQAVPVGLLNPQRLVSMAESRSLRRRLDGYAVTFVDRDGDWSERTERALRPRVERVQGKNTFDPVRFEHVTDYYHAMWLARRTMAREILQPGEIEVELGREGRFYPPGSLLKVQHEGHRVGLGSGEVVGRIVDQNGATVGLRTMERFEMRGDRDYWVEFHVVDEGRNHVVARQLRYAEGLMGEDGRTDSLLFTVPISSGHDAPEIGNVLSVIDGPREAAARVLESKRCVVMDSGPTAGGYRLTLAGYDEEIYRTTAIDEIPEYRSSILPVPPRSPLPPYYRPVEREPWRPPPGVGENGNVWQGGADTGIPAFAPRYRGPTATADARNAGIVNGERMRPGDWVLFTGQTTGIWRSAYVMRWDGAAWEPVPMSADASGMYMAAMRDLVHGAGDSVAARAFVGDLMATRAFIDNLLVNLVVMRESGGIQSENFAEGRQGARILANGDAELNNARIRGHVEATGGFFQDVYIGNRAVFEGSINSGPLFASNDATVPERIIFVVNTGIQAIGSRFGVGALGERTINVAGGSFGTTTGLIQLVFDWVSVPVPHSPSARVSRLRIVFGHVTYTFQNTPTAHATINRTLTVNPSPGRTLRLIDLPANSRPAVSGTVYAAPSNIQGFTQDFALLIRR